jgi:cytochrome c biogenesis protein CcmG, thiol:disulfide interchange protein DsbE
LIEIVQYASSVPRRVARVVPSLLALGCAGALVALLVFGVLRSAPDRSLDEAIAAGRPAPAPAYRLELLQLGTPGGEVRRRLEAATDGNVLDSSRLRGTVQVVNFWSSWCTGCETEAAVLTRAWEHRGRGVLFVGIDVQDLTGDARQFIRRHGIDFPIVRDPGGDQLRRYGVIGLPETFVVDARGRVVSHVVGGLTATALRDALRSAGV